MYSFFPKFHEYRRLCGWRMMETWLNAIQIDGVFSHRRGSKGAIGSVCECHLLCIVVYFLNDRGQSLCTCIHNPATVQYMQVFLPAKPPLRKGCTRVMIHTVGVTHRAIKLIPNQRLHQIDSSLIAPWTVCEALALFLLLSFSSSTLLYSYRLSLCAHRIPSRRRGGGGGIFDCMRSHNRVLHLDIWF